LFGNASIVASLSADNIYRRIGETESFISDGTYYTNTPPTKAGGCGQLLDRADSVVEDRPLKNLIPPQETRSEALRFMALLFLVRTK
jgi:hypothetical protein